MPTTLYQFWRSSASWRVRWAALIKRVPFETVVIDLSSGEQLTPEHRLRNPMARVPVLHMDGVMLAESVAIIEYLEERFPEPALYPRDPLGRARVRQIVELVTSGIQPFQNSRALTDWFPRKEEQDALAAHFNSRGLQALEQLVSMIAAENGIDGPFSYGSTLTAADLFVVPQIASARRYGVDLSSFERLRSIERSAMATEHADAALPKNQPGARQG